MNNKNRIQSALYTSLISLLDKKHESVFQKKVAAMATSKTIVDTYIAPLLEDNKENSIQATKIKLLAQSLYIEELEHKLNLLSNQEDKTESVLSKPISNE
jgi:hypothetical protein